MGLLVAAVFTTAVALCGLALLLRQAECRRAVLLAFLAAVPLQPLAFYLVRMPFDANLRPLLGAGVLAAALQLLYAPLTEEPAKWLTALAPIVRRAIMRRPVAVALATGLGFGIGEIWFLAGTLFVSPNYPDLPFYMFSGFFCERLEVCFLHGVFVLAPFLQIARGRPFWIGGLVGMAAHFALNYPIYLAQQDAFGLGRARWQLALLLWSVAFVLIGALLACRTARRFSPALEPS